MYLLVENKGKKVKDAIDMVEIKWCGDEMKCR